MTVKCLMHYAAGDPHREVSLAGEAKMEYILSCFRRLGHGVQILSACPGGKGQKGSVKPIAEDMVLELLPCLGGGKISAVLFRMMLFFRLLCFVQPGDTLWVYHSLPLMGPVHLLKRLRPFRLILEVEELYGDVLEKEELRRRELAFFSLADAFLFPTEELNRLGNPGGKPYVLCHGPYHTDPPGEKWKDAIHVVYAGSADPRKGVFLAIQTAKYLPETYHIHILGKKTPEVVAALETVHPRCTLTHDGILRGKAYRDFLCRCHVGLCTQDAHAAFENSSFPSKILTYLACSLQVVCPDIPVLKHSGVGDLLHAYPADTPQAVADRIRTIKNTAGRERIQALDSAFLAQLRELLP